MIRSVGLCPQIYSVPLFIFFFKTDARGEEAIIGLRQWTTDVSAQ